jgi:hypothetical protein
MNWDQIVSKVSSYIVKIDTPSGSGTGFLCTYNYDQSWCAISTAYHVIASADEWQQPIKVHTQSKSAFLKESQRIIFPDRQTDSAVILFESAHLQFPDGLIPLRQIANPINIGSEVGWLGFPAIEPYTLCFFSGKVSARRDDLRSYLIDGVAINGVSGGPVLYASETDGVEIVGVMTAYRANRSYGDSLPGLSVAQDVSHFHGVVQQIRSIDEGRQKRAEIESQNPGGRTQET